MYDRRRDEEKARRLDWQERDNGGIADALKALPPLLRPTKSTGGEQAS